MDTRYSFPLNEVTRSWASIEYVSEVSPLRLPHDDPPSVLTCHWYVIGVLPAAAAENVAPPDENAVVDTSSGLSVKDGAARIVKEDETELMELIDAAETRSLRPVPGEFGTVHE